MITARDARPVDSPLLVALMTDFYAEAGYPLPATPAARTFDVLLADRSLGRAWVLEADGVPSGYIVLTVAFSMEYGGLRGFVDDLYVRQPQRGRGLAAVGLEAVRSAAMALGVRALVVETGHDNDVARRVYGRAGFVDSDRLLMSQPLAPPVHEQRDDSLT